MNSARRFRVLISDDSVFMRLVLKKLLTENGYEVVGEASDGKQAVQLFKALKPDLVTMDITMPVMDGIEAVKRIHEEDPLARIIMVTAIGQRDVIGEAINAGASGFIIKPFEGGEVLRTIVKILGK